MTDPIVPKNNSDPFPTLVKEFFSNLYVDMGTNQWTSKCKLCSLAITDTYQTTSNFLKHIINKHQFMLDKWKNNLFKANNEKCRCKT
jgi:hypothetical protein